MAGENNVRDGGLSPFKSRYEKVNVGLWGINLLTPNDPYMGRTAPHR